MREASRRHWILHLPLLCAFPERFMGPEFIKRDSGVTSWPILTDPLGAHECSELTIGDLARGTGSGQPRLEVNTQLHSALTNWLPGQQVSRQTYHRVSGLGPCWCSRNWSFWGEERGNPTSCPHPKNPFARVRWHRVSWLGADGESDMCTNQGVSKRREK